MVDILERFRLTRARQWPLSDFVRLTFSDLNDEDFDGRVSLVFAGGTIVRGAVVVQTPWNTAGGTTATATMILGDVDDDDRYTTSPIDLTTAGRTELDITGHQYAGPTFIRATFEEVFDGAGAAAADEGEAFLEFEVIVEDRGNEAAPSIEGAS